MNNTEQSTHIVCDCDRTEIVSALHSIPNWDHKISRMKIAKCSTKLISVEKGFKTANKSISYDFKSYAIKLKQVFSGRVLNASW